jgi:hypothetical protein
VQVRTGVVEVELASAEAVAEAAVVEDRSACPSVVRTDYLTSPIGEEYEPSDAVSGNSGCTARPGGGPLPGIARRKDLLAR